MEKSAPMVIAVASEIEMRQTLKKMKRLQREARSGFALVYGVLAGRECLLVKTGVGQKRASAAAKIIAAQSPALVLIIGAAGAADPRLSIGDIVVADRVLCASGEVFPCDASKTGAARTALTAAGLRVFSGPCLTVDRFVHRTAEKRALHERFGATAIDMESASIARKLCAAGISFVNIRVVSDAASADTADLAALYLLKKQGGSVGVARHYIQRPAELIRTVSLVRGLRRASRRIAESIMFLTTVL